MRRSRPPPDVAPASRGYLLDGIRNAIAMPAWIVGVSYLGIGSLARDAGHPLGAAVLSTLLIWASPAQLILYGSLVNGGLVAAAGIAVGLSAIRLMPMTLAVWPYLKRPGQRFPEQALLAHFVTATTWLDAMRRLPEMRDEARVPYYLGFGSTCLALSMVMTAVGFLLVDALPVPLAAALLCLTPIYFTVALASGARRVADWLAIMLGLALAPLALNLVGRDFDLLVTGLVGGTAAYLVDRRQRRAAAS